MQRFDLNCLVLHTCIIRPIFHMTLIHTITCHPTLIQLLDDSYVIFSYYHILIRFIFILSYIGMIFDWYDFWFIRGTIRTTLYKSTKVLIHDLLEQHKIRQTVCFGVIWWELHKIRQTVCFGVIWWSYTKSAKQCDFEFKSRAVYTIDTFSTTITWSLVWFGRLNWSCWHHR